MRLLTLVIPFFFVAQSAPALEKATLILLGGRVHTMEPGGPVAQAVAIGGDRLLYVGTDQGALPFRGPSTKVIHLRGKMVLPGFHDGHVHPVSGGVEVMRCDLANANSVAEAKALVIRYAKAHPKEKWVRGAGWNLALFPGGNPSKAILDEWVPDRPAAFSSFDSHSLWINSKAMRLAGIDKSTKDPVDGRIERDAGGNPTGVLREGAMSLVGKVTPGTTPEEHLDGLRLARDMAHRFGITSVFDASVHKADLAAYLEMERRKALKLRVTMAHYVDLKRGPEQVAEIVKLRNSIAGKSLRLTAGKIFSDGVIESKTAAVLEPYVGGGGLGHLNGSEESIRDLTLALGKEKLDVHVHAIGDRAVRVTLNAFEKQRQALPAWDSRNVISHLQLVDPADMPRFKAVNATASLQMLWAQADKLMIELNLPILPKERVRWTYPMKSLLQAGARVAGGSDWNVTSMNPLDAIEVGVTRMGLGLKGEGFIPEEKVSLHQMLAAYTVNAAYQLRQENLTGTLAPGKAADLVVLNRDLYETPLHEIHKAYVVMTLVSGEIVYRRKP